MKQRDIFGNWVEVGNQPKNIERNKDGSFKENPMVKMYGELKGERCKNCAYLIRKQYAKDYFKCQLRGNVEKCSTKSDHRANWPACKKFKKNDQ